MKILKFIKLKFGEVKRLNMNEINLMYSLSTSHYVTLN